MLCELWMHTSCAPRPAGAPRSAPLSCPLCSSQLRHKHTDASSDDGESGTGSRPGGSDEEPVSPVRAQCDAVVGVFA